MSEEKYSNQSRDPSQYDQLRKLGMSKETANRISNSDNSGREGDTYPKYDKWSKDDLYNKAEELNIEGYTEMNKDELIAILRNY